MTAHHQDTSGRKAESPPFRYRTWLFPALVLAGTFVRFIFGEDNGLWRCAPDQTAWELNLSLALKDGGMAYHELIYYPHEGGSPLLSLLALLLKPFSSVVPALSWAAVLVDALSRYVQIRVAERLFGRGTAIWFAAWTVLAVPELLPWGTVDFGLHALLAFVPFILVAYAMRPDRPSWKVGLLTGAGADLAYEVWVFAPAYMVWTLLSGGFELSTFKKLGGYSLGCAFGFLPHLCARVLFDNAFALEQMPVLGVRGLEQEAINVGSLLPNLWTVWYSTLPASFMLSAVEALSSRATCQIVLVFMVLGIGGALIGRYTHNRAKWLLLLVVLFFTLAYAISPLFTERIDAEGYLTYRHFAFIVPLLVLLMVEGFGRRRSAGPWLRGGWLLGCAVASLSYIGHAERCSETNYTATGWVLARKYGHDPDRLAALLRTAPEPSRADLSLGYGWGLTTTLFEHRVVGDTLAVRHMVELWSRFPEQERGRMLEGVRLAFAAGITPVLDKRIEPELLGRLVQERDR